MFQTDRLVAVALAGALLWSACGGGGGSSPPPIPPCSVSEQTCYVAMRGSDTNLGDRTHPLRTIAKAAQIAFNGYTITVGPGQYAGEITTRSVGVAPQGLVFLADPTGASTGDSPGAVVITAAGAGFKLSNSPGTRIDGFTITGAADAGIVLKSGCNDFIIQNCIVHDNSGDGIRVQDSAGVLVFNNLMYNNGGEGIGLVGTVSGSPDARVYSNTIYNSTDHGITIGTTTAASPNASVRNNIVEGNDSMAPSENIKVILSPRSDVGYDGDYNLVYPATYNPAGLRGAHDLAADAMFVNPPAGDFHLQSASKAVDRGGPLNVVDSEISILHSRTTVGGKKNLDSGQLDLGFHYLP